MIWLCHAHDYGSNAIMCLGYSHGGYGLCLYPMAMHAVCLCHTYIYDYDYDSQFLNGKLILSTVACASRTKP